VEQQERQQQYENQPEQRPEPQALHTLKARPVPEARSTHGGPSTRQARLRRVCGHGHSTDWRRTPKDRPRPPHPHGHAYPPDARGAVGPPHQRRHRLQSSTGLLMPRNRAARRPIAATAGSSSQRVSDRGQPRPPLPPARARNALKAAFRGGVKARPWG
jgi:hypothetical protein